MRNKIIEQTIDQVIDESNTPSDFKSVFKKYIKNKLIGIIKLSNIVYGIFKNGIIGYSIDKEQEGKGYMKEALMAVVEYAFKEMRLHRIEASALVENERSKGVLKTCGFKELGVNEKYLFIRSKWFYRNTKY